MLSGSGFPTIFSRYMFLGRWACVHTLLHMRTIYACSLWGDKTRIRHTFSLCTRRQRKCVDSCSRHNFTRQTQTCRFVGERRRQIAWANASPSIPIHCASLPIDHCCSLTAFHCRIIFSFSSLSMKSTHSFTRLSCWIIEWTISFSLNFCFLSSVIVAVYSLAIPSPSSIQKNMHFHTSLTDVSL